MQEIDPSVYVHPSAQLYGKLSIGEGSSVWPNVVMRSEIQEIRIGRMSNIQDFVMIHTAYDGPTVVGDHCSITHHVTLHGCIVEDDCLIGSRPPAQSSDRSSSTRSTGGDGDSARKGYRWAARKGRSAS